MNTPKAFDAKFEKLNNQICKINAEGKDVSTLTVKQIHQIIALAAKREDYFPTPKNQRKNLMWRPELDVLDSLADRFDDASRIIPVSLR